MTNTPHWANPGTNVNAIDFGQVTFTAILAANTTNETFGSGFESRSSAYVQFHISRSDG